MQFDSSSTPKLWFKRVILYKSLNPTVVIREIQPYRGLNIIVGRHSRDSALMDNPMVMAGHSVGKTTFCRLLRYCLGEQHFSTENGEQRLRASLPLSYVGAELEIDGSPWAVLRPMGTQKALSSAQEGISIEELATMTEKSSGYFEFRQALGKLLPSSVHHPEITYKWEHLLAWMARDQECRLRKFEVWRDSDSGADSLGFRKSKIYPIHLVRGMLDLLVSEETQWNNALLDLTKQQALLKEEHYSSSVDADYFYRDASKRLSEFIGEFKDTRYENIECLDGPVMLANAHRNKLSDKQVELEKQLEETDRNLFREQRYVANAIEYKKQIDALRTATPLPSQSNSDKQKTVSEAKKEKLEWLSEKVTSGNECRFANQRLLKNCEYVSAYMKDLADAERVSSLPDEQQKWYFAEMDAQRRENIQAIIKQQVDAEEALEEAIRRASFYESERKDTLQKISAFEREIERLDRSLQDFQYAERLGYGGIHDTKMQKIKEDLERLDSEIHYAKNQLDFYRDQSAKKNLGLQSFFDEIVHRILKANYSGTVVTSAENFAPQIRQGNVITGAAVESLSFVLMDITSMLAPIKGIGYHPGFLVHDSPREADLDIDPYHSFLTELAAITVEYGGEENAPFQYIVTTTTTPPENLEAYVKLSLAAYPADRMLFRQQLEENNLLIES